MPVTLAEWRQSQGMSQGTLARLIGCAQVQVQRWESGTTEPCAEYRAALAKVGYTKGNWMIRVDLTTEEARQIVLDLHEGDAHGLSDRGFPAPEIGQIQP